MATPSRLLVNNPTRLPSGGQVADEQPTRLPSGGQVVHVYGTGLNGGHPHDIPVDQNVTFHLRGAYGPSMSQMFADQYCGENGWRRLPRAPLRSHAEYLEFCRCLLDEPGHDRWQVLLRELGCPAPDDWIAYAAKYATLPPLPAHLTLPAPVWSFLSSVVLLYLQPTLLTALAQHMAWPMPTQRTAPNAIHFTGFSAGSYTAIALEAEYRLLSQRFRQPLCAGCATLGALGRPIIYLLALLQPHYCARTRFQRANATDHPLVG